MRRLFTLLFVCLLSSNVFAEEHPVVDLDVDLRTLNDGDPVNLKESYSGKVLLVVNTASRCGFTPQYEGLEKLYSEYKDDGLVVLGFPSNDFKQELSDEKKIQEFCRLTYGVEFPMFQKARVKEGEADLFYQRLGTAAGAYPRWNFHKYLIDREGRLVGSYESRVAPDSGPLYEQLKSLL